MSFPAEIYIRSNVEYTDDRGVPPEKYEYHVKGTLSVNENELTVSYAEPQQIGYDNCRTSFVLLKNDRNTVIMKRSGSIEMSCRFSKKEERQTCIYNNPVMPVELTVRTEKAFHSVTENGGSILLEYCIEVQDSAAEKIRLFANISKINDLE